MQCLVGKGEEVSVEHAPSEASLRERLIYDAAVIVGVLMLAIAVGL